MITKAYFDCVGHYSRWDIVQLKVKAERREAVEEDILHSIEKKLEKYEIELRKLEKVVRELLQKGLQSSQKY